MGRDDIVIGTIEGWPDFKNVIKWLSCIPSTDLHLVPLMMTAGKHACRDIAGEKDSWKSKLEQAEYQVHCTIKAVSYTHLLAGAHEPFWIKATVRFCRFNAFISCKKLSMAG